MSNFLNWLVMEVFGGMDPAVIVGFLVIAVLLTIWILFWIVQNISRQFTHEKIMQLNGLRQEDEQEYPHAEPFVNMHGLDESTMIPNNASPDDDHTDHGFLKGNI